MRVIQRYLSIISICLNGFTAATDVKELSKILIADYGDGPFRRALEPLFDWGSHAVGIILKITNKPPAV